MIYRRRVSCPPLGAAEAAPLDFVGSKAVRNTKIEICEEAQGAISTHQEYCESKQ